jgi:hypothetical protein
MKRSNNKKIIESLKTKYQDNYKIAYDLYKSFKFFEVCQIGECLTILVGRDKKDLLKKYLIDHARSEKELWGKVSQVMEFVKYENF